MLSMSRQQIADLIAHYGGDLNGLTVVGIRGAHGPNRRGVWDDEIYVYSPNVFAGFEGNTDPSRERKGTGFGANKGMAVLVAGKIYHAHGEGLHRGKYPALIQIKGPVTVMRDGSPPYLDVGMFGVNIHHGGLGTSSLGCQTIRPGNPWNTFIAMVHAELRRLKQSVVPYLLHDANGHSATAGLPVHKTGTLNHGSVGPEVSTLQTRLNAWAAQTTPRPFPPLKVDGDFGDATERAVKAFQAATGLEQDGLAGIKTLAALLA